VEVLLANPRGFCAGVDRAIEIVEIALERFGPPVYVRHEIVHNRTVVEDLRAKGAVFIEDPNDAPEGALLIFSAHGVSPLVREAAAKRGLRVLDATCPLVTKVHVETLRMRRLAVNLGPHFADGIEHIFDHHLARLALVRTRLVLHDGDAVLLITAQPGGDGFPGELPGLAVLVGESHLADRLDAVADGFALGHVDGSEHPHFQISGGMAHE
jgi:hypothetical protein